MYKRNNVHANNTQHHFLAGNWKNPQTEVNTYSLKSITDDIIIV